MNRLLVLLVTFLLSCGQKVNTVEAAREHVGAADSVGRDVGVSNTGVKTSSEYLWSDQLLLQVLVLLYAAVMACGG